jgi:hypothetical protein
METGQWYLSQPATSFAVAEAEALTGNRFISFHMRPLPPV